MESTLQHYGVPGMRWGVRRYQTKSGSLTAAGKKRYGMFGKKTTKKLTASKASSLKKKRLISEMSDDELKDKVKRLELEKRYRDLNPKKVSLGKRFMSSVGDGAMEGVKNATAQAVKNMITSLLEKKKD